LITNILVALDGSQTSADALGMALDIARKYSAKLTLLSVIPPALVPFVTYSPTGITPINPIATGQYYTQMTERLKEVLTRSREKVQDLNPELNISSTLVKGRPADQIVKHAKDMDADLIVIGQKGVGAVEGVLLGSVSDRVADDAHCPVLVVKPKTQTTG
jgi:nucleotide-binding universal stress UspA family protein